MMDFLFLKLPKAVPLMGTTTPIPPQPAKLLYSCGGTVYRWMEPGLHYHCPVQASAEFKRVPADWLEHPVYGWLCPKCAEKGGAPRALPTR